MLVQNPVSIQLPLKKDFDSEALMKLLNQGGNPQYKVTPTTNTFFDFSRMETIHFARWLFVPADDKESLAASLIYAANVDGDKDEHITATATEFEEDFEQILAFCDGYTKGSGANGIATYLRKYSLKTQGFYVGAPNRSVTQIKQEAELYDYLRDFVKDNGSDWKSEREAYEAIKENLAEDTRWEWARKHYELPKIKYLQLLLVALVVLLFLPIVLVMIVLIHFFYERPSDPDVVTQNKLPKKELREKKAQEDIIYQNQLSQVFGLKGGLRKLFLRFILWFTSQAARTLFVKGQLFGTPTIHFARWVIIDKGKRFVFFSNFDGSFDEYLGDFVDNNGWGLNAIYGAAKDYPKTFFVFGGGSYKILEFLGWGRKTQVLTQTWYSAYPWYGLQQIVDKSKLRTELFNSGDLDDKQIKEMLRRI